MKGPELPPFNILRTLEFGGLAKLFLQIHLEPETRQKIADVRTTLAQNPKLNAFLYINHMAYSDPAPAMHVAHLIDPWQKRRIVAMASDYHMNRIHVREYSAFINLGKLAGVTPIPAIQTYQVDNPDFGYTKTEAFANYKMLMQKFDSLHAKGPLIAFASPEGHRSETGSLQEKVESGIIKIGKHLEDVLYVPIGIRYEGGFKRNKLNIGTQTYITIGRTYFQEGRNNAPDITTLMNNLADALPNGMRGIWGTKILPNLGTVL